jgi:hypothetical protein
MNPAALQPARRIHRSPVMPAALAEDLDACPDTARGSQPFAHLEPGPEGLLFAAGCVLGSGLIYAVVLIARALA